MRNVALFVEDFAHETFLRAMVQRLGREHHVEVAFRPYSVRGGSGKVVRELRRFLSDLQRGRWELPDLLIVGREANCLGHQKRRQELEPLASNCGCQLVYAIPDPHIERWLLLDSAAFKAVLGRAGAVTCHSRSASVSTSRGCCWRQCAPLALRRYSAVSNTRRHSSRRWTCADWSRQTSRWAGC